MKSNLIAFFVPEFAVQHCIIIIMKTPDSCVT